MSRKFTDCRNYYTGLPNVIEKHELIPATKWFGLIKGERCVLCMRFFVNKILWIEYDN